MRAALVALGLLVAQTARAGPQQFLHLERVDVEPTYAGMVLVRAYVTLTELQGGFIKGVEAKDLDLVLGEAELKQVPHVASFGDLQEPLDLVVVVDVTRQFGEAVEGLTFDDRMKTFLAKLPPGTRGAIVTFGSRVEVVAPLGDPRVTANKWEAVVPDDDLAPPALLEALERAIRLLQGAKHARPIRRAILLFSDGVDENDGDFADPGRGQQAYADKVAAFTEKAIVPAQDAGITIHTVGFAPSGDSGPLRFLGLLSRKTRGTFRWARLPETLGEILDLLRDQVARQLVLTYVVPAARVPRGIEVRVSCRSAKCGAIPLRSEPRNAPVPSCGGDECAGICVEQSCAPLALLATRGTSGVVWIGIAGAAVALALLALALRRKRR